MRNALSRRRFGSLLVGLGASCAPIRRVVAGGLKKESGSFVHPGMLQSRADLRRMAEAVRRKDEPTFAGFQLLREHPQSQKTYRSIGAFVEIGRNPNLHFADFDRDANAAYQCALMALITGDVEYSRVSIEILDDWSQTLKRISGADAVLCASLGGFKIANAAELIRAGNFGWSLTGVARFALLLRQVFLPVIENFSAFANGNWDTAAIKLMLAIAIYTEDDALFERALLYYRHGCGDGRLEHYIYANGQCQESGRDQQHTQLGLAHMGDCCEMAWHQGLDLYASLNNRLLLGFEYTARYGLGGEVPFDPDVDQTGKYRHTLISPRSALRPVYEQIFNHYVNRQGLAAPWTQRAAEKVRPEGAPFQADATGYGTLLYTRPLGANDRTGVSVERAAGLYSNSDGGVIALDFVPPSTANPCILTRSETIDGPYRPVGNVKNGYFEDRSARQGKTYFYRVRVRGQRSGSESTSQVAGLPTGWQFESQAGDAGQTHVSSDGKIFRFTAPGEPKPTSASQFSFVHHEMPTQGTFTARLLPLIASQFLSVGIAVRSSDGAAGALLLLSPKSGPAEHPTWAGTLFNYSSAARNLEEVIARALGAPMITYGRVMEALWLRLSCNQEAVRAAISSDGETWDELGSSPVRAKELTVGLALNSGLGSLPTEVCFDNLAFL